MNFEDLNAFLVNIGQGCYARSPPGQGEVPTASAAETAVALLHNVNGARGPNLIALAEDLATGGATPTVRNYWADVAAYLNTSPNVGPLQALAYGTSQDMFTLTLSNTGQTPYTYTVTAEKDGSQDPEWIVLSTTEGDLAPGTYVDLTVTAERCALAANAEYTAAVTVDVGSSSWVLPVTLSKYLTSPRITPWTDVPNLGGSIDLDGLIRAGLEQWQTVTDTVILEPADPTNQWDAFRSWFVATRQDLKEVTGHDMHLIMALKTGGYLQANGTAMPDLIAGWGAFADTVVDALGALGETVFAVDDEPSIVCDLYRDGSC